MLERDFFSRIGPNSSIMRSKNVHRLQSAVVSR
ncbi:hypothetical protein EG68_07430 [Paragonimus skrjabini miyazakii]|uniref:Uncharacterized protein n=1 Tax=Paragonimus skrjabini miyazakii TaxID=59628 RepID=A0A8S9YU91_9TREM|nr:hypothetical protein EG68_07430 [Paragonimus skrjabini miyazakii]